MLVRDFDHGPSDRRGRPILQDPITGLEGGKLVQKKPSSRRVDPQHGRMVRRQSIRHRHHTVQRPVARLPPGLAINEHLAADPCPVHARTQVYHPPATLAARHVGQIPRLAILALDHIEIRRVDRRTEHTNSDLMLPGRHYGDLINLEHFTRPSAPMVAGSVGGSHVLSLAT